MYRRKPTTTSNLWLARVLWELDAIEFGDFTLGRTTLHSPVYINPRRLISRPQALRRAARVMLNEVLALRSMLHPHIAPFQLVAGIPWGGLHLATAFSLASNIPLIYVRPRSNRAPSEAIVEGSYEKGQTVLLIDDLVTTGGSIIETATNLGMAGLHVKDIIVLIDRQEGAKDRLKGYGYNLISILGLEPLLNYLMSTGKIEEEWYRKSIDYIQARRPQR